MMAFIIMPVFCSSDSLNLIEYLELEGHPSNIQINEIPAEDDIVLSPYGVSYRSGEAPKYARSFQVSKEALEMLGCFKVYQNDLKSGYASSVPASLVIRSIMCYIPFIARTPSIIVDIDIKGPVFSENCHCEELHKEYMLYFCTDETFKIAGDFYTSVRKLRESSIQVPLILDLIQLSDINFKHLKNLSLYPNYYSPLPKIDFLNDRFYSIFSFEKMEGDLGEENDWFLSGLTTGDNASVLATFYKPQPCLSAYPGVDKLIIHFKKNAKLKYVNPGFLEQTKDSIKKPIFDDELMFQFEPESDEEDK